MRKHFKFPRLFYPQFFSLLLCVLVHNIAIGGVHYSIPLEGREMEVGNLLNWTTSEEENSQIFVVQRSEDGIRYIDVGKVDAKGNTDDENGYHFIDININQEKVIYRLKQIDYDGTFHHSRHIIIHKKLSNNFMVMTMSNPEVSKNFELTIDARQIDNLSYQVLNQEKDIIMDVEQTLNFGLNTLIFDFENEPVGTYTVRLKAGNEEEKLVIKKVERQDYYPNTASREQLNRN